MISLGKERKVYLNYLLLLLLIFPIVFLKLGSFHMRWWDESMFAVNSYEMMHNGKWFSLYYDNFPDYFNTKPPLTSWLQILSVKCFGYTEFAVRLPSAMAACCSVLIIFRFSVKHFDYLWAWIAALILLTSFGFIHYHTARTADSDSLLTLFVLVSNLYFIEFILTKEKRNVLMFFLFITLAVSVKLYAGLLFIPAYIIVLIYKKHFKAFTINWYFIAGMLFFVFSIGSLLYLRELDAPGYLNEVLFKDAGRMAIVVENHSQSTFFYFDNLFNLRFSIWSTFFVIGVLFIFFKEESNQTNILKIIFLFILVYLTIITISVTKLDWYDMPLFPFLALIAAYPIYYLIQNIKKGEKQLSSLKKSSIVALMFLYPYLIQFSKSQGNSISDGEIKLESKEMYLFNKIKENESLNGLKVFHQGWNGSLLFYKYNLAEKGQKMEIVYDISNISVNDKVLVNNDSLKTILKKTFVLTCIDEKHNAEVFNVKEKR